MTCGRTVTAMVADLPLVIVPILQTTVLPTMETEPWLLVTRRTTASPVRMLVRKTLGAMEGPLLLTMRVKVSSEPARGTAGELVRRKLRLAVTSTSNGLPLPV